jgi:hypothetical protein
MLTPDLILVPTAIWMLQIESSTLSRERATIEFPVADGRSGHPSFAVSHNFRTGSELSGHKVALPRGAIPALVTQARINPLSRRLEFRTAAPLSAILSGEHMTGDSAPSRSKRHARHQAARAYFASRRNRDLAGCCASAATRGAAPNCRALADRAINGLRFQGPNWSIHLPVRSGPIAETPIPQSRLGDVTYNLPSPRA